MKLNPNLLSGLLAGYTAWRQGPPSNLDLSSKRVDGLVDYLR
jgi:hypothetical protein